MQERGPQQRLYGVQVRGGAAITIKLDCPQRGHGTYQPMAFTQKWHLLTHSAY